MPEIDDPHQREMQVWNIIASFHSVLWQKLILEGSRYFRNHGSRIGYQRQSYRNNFSPKKFREKIIPLYSALCLLMA